VRAAWLHREGPFEPSPTAHATLVAIVRGDESCGARLRPAAEATCVLRVQQTSTGPGRSSSRRFVSIQVHLIRIKRPCCQVHSIRIGRPWCPMPGCGRLRNPRANPAIQPSAVPLDPLREAALLRHHAPSLSVPCTRFPTACATGSCIAFASPLSGSTTLREVQPLRCSEHAIGGRRGQRGFGSAVVNRLLKSEKAVDCVGKGGKKSMRNAERRMRNEKRTHQKQGENAGRKCGRLGFLGFQFRIPNSTFGVQGVGGSTRSWNFWKSFCAASTRLSCDLFLRAAERGCSVAVQSGVRV